MAVEIDTSGPLRGVDALTRLVRAVVEGGEHDELDWLEWKSELDLATKQGALQVARAILGMANRTVERAALHCGGCGYVVVGAAPGNLRGVESVDPASFVPKVVAYVGEDPDAPLWTPSWQSLDGKAVLVITVEAPKHGDPIHSLRREGTTGGRSQTTYLRGTVFVRRPGSTEQATDQDLAALQARLLKSASAAGALQVGLTPPVPVGWLARDAVVAKAERWAQDEAEARRRPWPTEDASGPAGLASLLDALRSPPDPRTDDEYDQELDDWRNGLVRAALSDLPRRLFTSQLLVSLSVENTSEKYLPGVELVLSLNHPTLMLHSVRPARVKYPKPPAPWGIRSMLPSGLHLDYSLDIAPMHEAPPNVEVLADGRTVAFELGDIRPQKFAHSDAFLLVPIGRPEPGLRGTWTATVKERDGVIQGDFEWAAHREPWDVGLFEWPEPDGQQP